MPLTASDCVVFVIAITYLIFLWQSRSRSSLPLPPGPPRWPLVGSLFSMPKNHEMRETFTAWGKQYGDVTYARALDQNIIVLNSREATVELLERRSALYSHRPRLVMASEIVGWGDSLAMMNYGDSFKQTRKLLYEGMSPKAMETLVSLQEEKALKFLQMVLSTPNKFYEHIRGTATATVMKVTYGYDVQEHNDYYVGLAEDAVNMFSLVTTPGLFFVDVFPLLKHVPWASFKTKARVWRKLMMDFCDRPMQYTREQMAAGISQPCLMVSWIERADDLLKKSEADKHESIIKWAGAAIYGGAADTTASANSTFFLAMLHYPAAQATAQAEIDRVVGKDRLPTYQDRTSLPYVEALYKEVLRWQPVVPFSIPHRLDWEKDDEYQGMRIPKGSVIIPNIWGMTHDPEVYHDPDTFKPERFLGSDGGSPEPDSENIVFGFGRRRCPGIYLAHSSVWLTIALTLSAFDIAPVVDSDGKPMLPGLNYSQTTISYPEPFECTIKPRSSKARSLVEDSIIAV